ncbi:hypothetical protein U1Q18_013683 [Sarracenia purpurea var. burkii]
MHSYNSLIYLIIFQQKLFYYNHKTKYKKKTNQAISLFQGIMTEIYRSCRATIDDTGEYRRETVLGRRIYKRENPIIEFTMETMPIKKKESSQNMFKLFLKSTPINTLVASSTVAIFLLLPLLVFSYWLH